MSKCKEKAAEEVKNETAEECVQPQQEETAQEQPAQQDDKIAQLEEKAAYYMDIARRTQADFENYRKRNATVRADGYNDGKTDAIKAFLPVLDNIDLAIAHNKDGAMLEGLKLIRQQVDAMLSQLGAGELGEKGEEFDPNKHEAVVQSPCGEGEQPGTVAEVLRKGYKLGDRVIRYAMVRVTE